MFIQALIYSFLTIIVGLLAIDELVYLPHIPRDAIKIIQVGQMRSGSTFQWYVLCSIMRLRHPLEEVHCNDDEKILSYDSRIQVIKTHGQSLHHYFYIVPKEKLFFFYSVKSDYPVNDVDISYTQRYEDLTRREVGVLLDYQKMFSLSDLDTQLLFQHMRYWMIIRRCCGSQQSYDNRLKLHNSTSPRAKAFISYDYLSCDIYDLDLVEEMFLQTNLSQRYPDDLYSANVRPTENIKKGFCRQSAEKIKAGYDFNDEKWNQSRGLRRR